MTSGELKRWLEKRGCSFEPAKGGHLIVRLGDKKTILPMHGKITKSRNEDRHGSRNKEGFRVEVRFR
jgi:hypothetical protein